MAKQVAGHGRGKVATTLAARSIWTRARTLPEEETRSGQPGEAGAGAGLPRVTWVPVSRPLRGRDISREVAMVRVVFGWA